MGRAPQIPGKEIIQSVLEVYERGRSVDALRRAEAFAPLDQWAGIDECVLAARIAANTGAPRLATRLSVRAWRTDRNHPAARLQYGFQLAERRGPVAAWFFLRNLTPGSTPTPTQQAELLALQASAAADLRDFAATENLLQQAEASGTREPWVHLQRAHLLEHLDRLEEAVVAASAAGALHKHPFYRPGVQVRARLLQLLDRDEEAIQLLNEAGAVLQNGPVTVQLYALLTENNRWAEAEAALERYVELSPLLEAPLKKWVAAQRARVAYQLGKRTDAARHAEGLDDDFHKRFARKLGEAPADPERVQLDVSFVRQHFKTCAPATLAALGRFWRLPAEHLKLAEAMCYDGTPHWQQRQWAERNDWFVREFRVTEECAVELIGRGIPFAISTVEATSAHMQAVAGFDRTRSTLLLRDPGQPYTVEVQAEEFFKRYRPFGPHGMVFLPMAERARLDEVTLPDAEAYDDYHRFSVALAGHERAVAAAILESMQQKLDGHPITWETRLDLATYDANLPEQGRCLDELLALFPENAARLLRRLNCFRDASRDERIRFLERACAATTADAALFVELARALQGDARCLPTARRWLKRATRWRPMDPNALCVRADLAWEQGQFEEATELYRCAANLESFREGLYQSWFQACRRTRRTDQAMTHLQERFVRFGDRSEQPALTLAWAWREMEQPVRAQEVLNEAIRRRPNDGYLSLRAAGLVSRLGRHAEAAQLLEGIKNRVRENDWLRTAAEIAEGQFDTATALQRFREILQREPLALEAHGGVARSLARLEGRINALAHLRKACAEFPHHCGLQRMLVEWSRDGGPGVVETAARALLRIEPRDAWALRELAAALANSGRNTEALVEATEAARIEPNNAYSFSILGRVHQRLRQLPEARAEFRRAVELSVDNGDAIHALLDLALTDRERKEELAFVEQELIRQVVRGNGLLAYLELARPVIAPEKLLESLWLAHSQRPDLWHVWSALVSQLGYMGQLDQARDIARQSTEKFPHLPRTWLDLATVYQWRREPAEEVAAAQHAFEINPAWGRSTLALAGAFERCGRLDDAGTVYQRALQHSADDAQLHACHAHLLWRQRKPEAAFAAIEQALRLSPGYEWAWNLLKDWASQRGETERATNFSRTLTRERPGEMYVWLTLARVLADSDAVPEQLAAVDKAIGLDAWATEAWDLKAQLLAKAERFDEAIRACEEGLAACTTDVHILQGRRAWIEGQRRQLAEAVRLMRNVLAENSSYAWGWTQLAHWLAEQSQFAEATTALEQLLRLRPHDAWVNRQLGFLRLKQQNQAGAREAFQKALQIAPTDAYAAQNIFDLQLQTNDLSGAGATLRVMQTHQPGMRTLAAEILLQLRGTDKSAPLKGFQAMCASPDPDAWPVDTVAEAFRKLGRSAAALKVLKHSLKNNPHNPQAAAAAINLLLARRKDFSAVRLFLNLPPGEPQRRAAGPLVQGLAKMKSRLSLRWLLWRRRAVLAKDDFAWGQVGYALTNLKRPKEVVRWLADWRTRPAVQPWMMFNLCLALRNLGRYDEANAVARHVLATWGHREGSADMHLFLAVEDALAGEMKAAEGHLQQAVTRPGVPHDQELLAIAQALVAFQKSPPTERQACFKVIRGPLNEQFSGTRLLHVLKDVRRTFRRAGKVVVKEGGGWKARLWFTWRLDWQWLLLPLAPLALVVIIQPPVLLGIVIWRLVKRLDNKRPAA